MPRLSIGPGTVTGGVVDVWCTTKGQSPAASSVFGTMVLAMSRRDVIARPVIDSAVLMFGTFGVRLEKNVVGTLMETSFFARSNLPGNGTPTLVRNGDSMWKL